MVQNILINCVFYLNDELKQHNLIKKHSKHFNQNIKHSARRFSKQI